MPDTIARTSYLASHVVLLRGYANLVPIQAELERLVATSPWRHMQTPGGGCMSAAMTNCGDLGWTSDRNGYCYRPNDPLTGNPWPAIPPAWLELAQRAAQAAGFATFEPDACLVNRYQPGSRLGLHRDEDERDFAHPVVSVSLGSPARFVLGGNRRADPTTGLMLYAGDVLVWGGPDRLRYHGVGVPRRVKGNSRPPERLNLTFRRAG